MMASLRLATIYLGHPCTSSQWPSRRQARLAPPRAPWTFKDRQSCFVLFKVMTKTMMMMTMLTMMRMMTMMMITWSRSWSHSGCDTLPRPRWCCCKPEHWWIGDVGHFHYDKVMSGDFGVDDNNKQNQYNFILSVVEITFSSPSLQISTVSVNLWWKEKNTKVHWF